MVRFGVRSALTLTLAVMPGLQAATPLGHLPGPAQERVVLYGNVHKAVRDLMPMGRTDPGLAMDHIILSFQMRPEARADLERLLAEQQDPASRRYHQWLTPEQFGAAFGPRPEEIASVSAWLTEQGFTVDEGARGGMTLTFSGTATQVEQAFRTPMMEYQVQGRQVHANAADPSVPAELAPLVAGVVSLHNVPRQMAHTLLHPLTLAERSRLLASKLLATASDGNHYLAPGDFATIYNLGPLYAAGINGAGVGIAIVGRSNPGTADWVGFANTFALTGNLPTIRIGVTDPGSVSTNEDMEANLDVEWSWAVARGAAVTLVCSKTTNATDGVDLSAQYIVNNAVAPVMSTSFGSCEKSMGTTESQFYNDLWSQAATQGITSLVAAGDSGAADCDDPGSTTGTGGAAVNGLASTPYNTCVGGTMFNEGTASYWTNQNPVQPWGATATSYIPEVAWNESGSVPGGVQLWATGGGVSTLYAKPNWQVAPGVPSDGHRDVPDVSLTASGHDAYIIFTHGWPGAVGGTSCSTPAFAGLMALVVQKTGASQGNANRTFYALGNAQYTTGASVFHDIKSGNNAVPGVSGFTARTGYDLATGLGSVDAAQLLDNWAASISTPHPSIGLLVGTPATLSATVTGAASSTVTWSASGGALTPTPGANTATFSAASAGTYTVTAACADATARTATITVVVHDADLRGAGQTPTGLDVLEVLGYYGTSSTAGDLNGDAAVDSSDVNLLLNLLWKN